ncbi:conserved membrane hypothetical protein [uncultured Desulfobacterium sp.]|uniref:Eight transmembrane protein EpsH n=1 Tax=uncultured Desulfobacterium sp. TaxID=201089 RepID=A0A445MZR7_9BACT|nr:conserved membrane hypothetical protein [uncultured Desulfobacterium sp.]
MIKTWLSIIILVFSFFGLYHDIIFKLVQDWISDDNYSHGFLIPIIAAYLVWQRKERLSIIQARPSNAGMIIFLGGLFIFLFSYIGAELFTMRFSMLIVIFGLVAFLMGIEFGKAALIPVAYLVFMIPIPAIIWNKLAFPLKLFATKMAVGTIGLLNIPVYREGNIIHLSNTTLQVVDACSGMRSLASLLALSAAFAFITNHSKTRKWLLFISAIPIAIFLNIVRLSVTAVLAQHYGPQSAEGFLHEFSGLFVFAFAILCLYLVHAALQKLSPVPHHA